MLTPMRGSVTAKVADKNGKAPDAREGVAIIAQILLSGGRWTLRGYKTGYVTVRVNTEVWYDPDKGKRYGWPTR